MRPVSLVITGWTRLFRRLSAWLRNWKSSKLRKKRLHETSLTLSNALNGLRCGNELAVELTWETGAKKYWKFVRTEKWFELWESPDQKIYTRLDFPKPKPETYIIQGTPVTVGMDKDEWLEAMLEILDGQPPAPDPYG